MALNILVKLLLLVILATVSTGNCVKKKCPLGQFYNVTSGSCVSSCYPHYGNWATGNCTKGIVFVYGVIAHKKTIDSRIKPGIEGTNKKFGMHTSALKVWIIYMKTRRS